MTEHFVVMTVQGVVDGHFLSRTITAAGVFDFETRAQLFPWMLEQFPPELASLPVVFFSAEPNALAKPEVSR